MTPQDRHRRTRAYVRAQYRSESHYRRAGAFCPVLTARESHAWGRLPEAARNSIQDWGNK